VEVAQLREALRQAQAAQGLSEVWPAQGLLARVVGRSLVPTQHSIVLNRGGRDGLQAGSVLLDPLGVVGRVAELSGGQATALLITDVRSRLGGLVERSRELGLVVGRGRGLCELIYLEADADVEPGDQVVTAGLSDEVPKGLALGTVVRVARDAALGSARAWVRPAARLGRLEDVWCVTTGGR
jgi:rod shape-determining protein MreC